LTYHPEDEEILGCAVSERFSLSQHLSLPDLFTVIAEAKLHSEPAMQSHRLKSGGKAVAKNFFQKNKIL
jgi:hypothetical protein